LAEEQLLPNSPAALILALELTMALVPVYAPTLALELELALLKVPCGNEDK